MFDVSQYVKKIVDSKPSGSGNYIRDGKFMLMIRSLQIKPSDQGKGAVWFIAEFLVMAAAPVDVPPELIKDKPVSPPNAVGSDCSLCLDLNSQMGPANVKELACAVLNIKHDQLTAEALSAWIGANVDVPGGNPSWKLPGNIDQPLKGVALNASTSRKLIKSGANMGKPIVNIRWEHVPMTRESIAQARQMMQPAKAETPVGQPQTA